jgi:hypothetical protein
VTVVRKPGAWEFWLAWVLANSAGLGIGFGLARIVALSLGGELFMDTGAPSYGLVNGTFAWVIAGAVLGLGHWIVLRQHTRWAIWWVVALILFFGASAAWGGFEDGRITMPWIPGGIMYGALLGAISGIPLTWALRRQKVAHL